MIDLLAAAQDYQSGLNRLINTIASQAYEVAAARRTPEQFLELIQASASTMLLLSNPVKSGTTILAEAIHFKRNRALNERKAVKARENREAAHFGERVIRPSTAPRTMSEPGQFFSNEPVLVPDTPTNVLNTDSEQVQSNTELILDDESKSSILDFINKQDDNKPSKG